MKRVDIITLIGKNYLVSNIENDEFSYPKEFKKESIEFHPIVSSKDGRKFEKLDMRFVKNDVSILVETKANFNTDLDSAKEQLSAYVEYEKELNNNKIIAREYDLKK